MQDQQTKTEHKFGEIQNNKYGNMNRFEIHIKEQVRIRILWD